MHLVDEAFSIHKKRSLQVGSVVREMKLLGGHSSSRQGLNRSCPMASPSAEDGATFALFSPLPLGTVGGSEVVDLDHLGSFRDVPPSWTYASY